MHLKAPAIYDPCAPGSRLGIPQSSFIEQHALEQLPAHISGLHFHTLCEQGFEPLDRTLNAVNNSSANCSTNVGG